MHDRNGKPLKKGDVVLIPCVITEEQGGEELCNVAVESIFGRRPDGDKERFSGFNTGVVLRCRREDFWMLGNDIQMAMAEAGPTAGNA